MNVKIVSFPQNEDPDSYSKKLTSNEFQKYLDETAEDFVDYLIDIYKLSEETDPGKIIELKKKIILSISNIPDAFSREEYCRIYHKKLRITEQSLLKEVNQARFMIKPKSANNLTHLNSSPPTKLLEEKKNENKLHKQEKELLRLLINYGNEKIIIEKDEGSVASMIIYELEHDNITFSSPKHQKLFNAILDNIKNYGTINIQKLMISADNDINMQTIDLIAQAHNISLNWKKEYNITTGREVDKLYDTTVKAILALKKGIVDVQISELQDQLKCENIPEGILQKLNDLTRLKSKIAKTLGRNVG